MNVSDKRCFLTSPDLEQKISPDDRNHLATALQECISIDSDVLFQGYFKLSPSTIRSTKASPNTLAKIYNLLHKWIDKEGNNATYGRVNFILDEAELIGIKQLWWIKYKETLEQQDSFEKHRSILNEKVFCLSCCSITENEWNNFMAELNQNLKSKLKKSKNNSRLDFLNRWLERRGYEVALDELREALKKTCLRRFVHKLNDLAQDKQSEMGKCFIDYMEDQYDDELSKLTEEEKEDIYHALRPDDPPTDEDEAFDAIVIDGNRGFNKFYKALLSHNKCDIAKVFGNNCNGISNIKELNQPYFTKFSAYRDMSETLQDKRFLRLYGPKGSGKSVCSYIFAQTFIQENLLSVVWFVDCTDDNSVSQSITSFNKELYGAGISLQDGSGPVVIKQLVDDLKCHELPVLLVLDNVKKFHRQCKELCRELKAYEKSFILEISVEEESSTADNFPTQKVSGFFPKESLNFLVASEDQCNAANATDERDSAVKIANNCNHLPLRLALVKAYCRDEANQIEPSYVDYLQLMETDEGRDFVQQWEKNIGLKRVSEDVLIHDNSLLETQEIKKELETLKSRVKNDKNELDEKIKTLTNTTKEENNSFQLKIEKQQALLTKMQKDFKQTSLENEMLNNRIEELLKRNKTLEVECRSALEWKRKHDELEEKYSKIECDRDRLQQMVDHLTAGNESSTQSSMSSGSENRSMTFTPDSRSKGIGYFWDIENCQVPKGCSAYELVQKIRNKFPDYCEKEFLTCVDNNKLSDKVCDELRDAKVTMVYVKATAKNAADDHLKEKIRKFAQEQSYQTTTIVIITGDVNFVSVIHELRRGLNFNVVLIHKTNSSKNLIEHANSAIKYEDFFEDLSRTSQQRNNVPQECTLQVSNLPHTIPDKPDLKPNEVKKRICNRLNRLFANCGGKVLEINLNNGVAILQFKTGDAQQRALFRVNDEDVFGSKIKVTKEEEEPTTSGSM